MPAIPEGMNTLTPHLCCADANGALDFYRRAFDAEEVTRLVGPDGKLMHGALRIGDSQLMLGEERPEWGALGPKSLNGSPVVLHLYVQDVDAAVEKAVAVGCQVKMPPADMFWGDRYGQVEDPYGYRWALATHLRDVSPDEMRDAVRRMTPPG